MRRRSPPAVLLGLALGGCTSGDLDGASGPPMFALEPLQTVASASGRLSVAIRTWPSPPVKGVNVVQYVVASGDGAGTGGLAIDVVPWMPADGHGTSVVPAVVDQGGGVYQIDRVYLFMQGRWELRSRIAAGAQSDSAVPTLDVR